MSNNELINLFTLSLATGRRTRRVGGRFGTAGRVLCIEKPRCQGRVPILLKSLAGIQGNASN